MSGTSHFAMHGDHRQWISEDQLWREDLRAWQDEMQTALRAIDEVRAAFVRQQERLRSHAGSIRAVEQAVAAHEHAIATYQRGASEEGTLPSPGTHLAEAEAHARHREQHEGIKRLHHTLMAHCSAFSRSILKAVE